MKTEVERQRRLGGRTWLITGRHTHESGIVAAAAVKTAGGNTVTIVGEDVGDNLAFWASAGRECLESAATCIVHAARRFDVSGGCEDESCVDEYRGYRVDSLKADIPVAMTAAALLANRDPMMEAIAEALRRRRLRA